MTNATRVTKTTLDFNIELLDKYGYTNLLTEKREIQFQDVLRIAKGMAIGEISSEVAKNMLFCASLGTIQKIVIQYRLSQEDAQDLIQDEWMRMAHLVDKTTASSVGEFVHLVGKDAYRELAKKCLKYKLKFGLNGQIW